MAEIVGWLIVAPAIAGLLIAIGFFIYLVAEAIRMHLEHVRTDPRRGRLGGSLWFCRWHIANWLVLGALNIAPKGAARDLLEDYLNAYGREVLNTIRLARPDPADIP